MARKLDRDEVSLIVLASLIPFDLCREMFAQSVREAEQTATPEDRRRLMVTKTEEIELLAEYPELRDFRSFEMTEEINGARCDLVEEWVHTIMIALRCPDLHGVVRLDQNLWPLVGGKDVLPAKELSPRIACAAMGCERMSPKGIERLHAAFVAALHAKLDRDPKGVRLEDVVIRKHADGYLAVLR